MIGKVVWSVAAGWNLFPIMRENLQIINRVKDEEWLEHEIEGGKYLNQIEFIQLCLKMTLNTF